MKIILILFLLLSSNVVFAMETSNTKQSILEEFKKKLQEEEELQQELKKNKTLTNEDLNGLVKENDTTFKDILDSARKTDEEIAFEKEMKSQREKELEAQKKRREEERKRREKEEERITKENEKIQKEEERLREEEKKLKEEEEALARDQKNEARRKKFEETKNKLKTKFDELLKRKNELNNEAEQLNQEAIKAETEEIKQQQMPANVVQKEGVINKIFNITDTGVSEEFLYSDEYRRLTTNKTDISKVDINKESDIPVVNIKEKDIINFDTSDIPQELLAYKRSAQNRHIPSIMSNSDIQQIAMAAIEENNLQVLRGVIEQTKNPDFLIDKNRTMLSYAIETGNYILTRYLIYSGASINRLDGLANNPLHVSVTNHNINISNLLIDNGADINGQNIDGDTPLLLAIKTNQDDMALDLIRKGADLNIRNKAGDDAMSLCIKNNKRKLQQYIREIIRIEEKGKK